MKIDFSDICRQYGVKAEPKTLNQSAEPCRGIHSWKSSLVVLFCGAVEVVGECEADTSITAIKGAFEDAIKRYLLRYPSEKIALTGEVLEVVR